MFVTEANHETCPAYYFRIDYRNSFYLSYDVKIYTCIDEAWI